MSNYSNVVNATKKGINDFYRLLNLHKLSRLNSGWVGSENDCADTSLDSFNSYLNGCALVNKNDASNATLFDIPMNSRGFDKKGRYGSGIPSDIGLCRNVNLKSEFGISTHEPLYQVTEVTSFDYLASSTASTTIGGKIRAEMSDKTLTIYPNGSTNGIIVSPIDGTYWNNTDKFMLKPLDGASYLHNIFCFVSVDKSYGGVVVYVTPNFINWNIHQIIPDTTSDVEWVALTDVSETSLTVSADNATLVHNIIKKYFHVLPNNNYLIMYPLAMFNGEDKTTMAKMYSPWQNDALLTIKDPYDTTEDYQDKAINGISSYLTENGENILYYNNRLEMPLVLYRGRTMGTFNSDVYSNYNKSIIEAPKVAKVYGMPETKEDKMTYTEEVDGMSIDCAINIFESRSGNLTDDDIPAAAVGLAIGDVADSIYDNESDEFKHYNQVELYVDKSIDMMDNIDIDFNEYLFSNGIPGEKIREGEITDIEDYIVPIVPIPVAVNECVFEVIAPPTCYRDNLRCRATIFGNTLYSDAVKITNNPSLSDGDLY